MTDLEQEHDACSPDGAADPALADRLVGRLQPLDEDEAQGLFDDLIDTDRARQTDTGLAALLAGNDDLRQFLGAVMQLSPYLRALVLADSQRLAGILKSDPEAHLRELCRRARLSAGAPDEAQLMRTLRLLKQEIALTVALADLGGVWDVEEVTRALSQAADATLAGAIGWLLGEAASAGRFRPQDAARPEPGSGLIILAMGKHGAGELNFSSDIDLIALYDAAAAPLAEGQEPSVFFVRLIRRLVKIMQERTEHGYVFRIDLRLRPDPGATAVAINLDAAIAYYEALGQNWERAALIKARPCAGDLAAGEAFLDEIAPFVWRKYFDYAAIADVHSIKRQIHAHKGHGRIAVAGHNLKLGRGGIREIEFFVQTQQLIAGGRNPRLRGRRTLDMLDALARENWISARTRDEMKEAYRFLRRIEHRIQMVADEQTQTLPEDTQGVLRIARLAGFAGHDEFAEALLAHLERVQHHYAELFEEEPSLSSDLGSLVFTGDDDDPATLETLSRLGFRRPAEVTRAVRSWHFGRYAATRSARARERLTEITPALLEALAATASPDAALIAFDRFLAGLPTGVQLFSLLRSNPALLHLLANILGTAPRLAAIVTRHPRVLDGVLDPAFFEEVPNGEEFARRLDDTLAEAGNYEDALDRARIFGQEQGFLIGVRILSGAITADRAGSAFALLASVILDRLLRLVEREFATTHGEMPGGAAVILALGKLGGCEMTASSDLDLILLYDYDDDPGTSDGRRSLSGSQYYIRLTQRLVAALGAPTSEGTLYEVDFRLRPSGKAGPLATRIDSFERYQQQEAWTWEHMALTRARVVAGDRALAERARTVIRRVLTRRRNADEVRRDVRDMRARIEAEKGIDDPWDLKNVAGGLVDLEFIAQYLQLVHAARHPEILAVNTLTALNEAARAGLLPAAEADILIPAARLYQNLTQILRLCIETRFVPQEAPGEFRDFLARAGELPDFGTLQAHLVETQAAVRRSFERVIGNIGHARK